VINDLEVSVVTLSCHTGINIRYKDYYLKPRGRAGSLTQVSCINYAMDFQFSQGKQDKFLFNFHLLFIQICKSICRQPNITYSFSYQLIRLIFFELLCWDRLYKNVVRLTKFYTAGSNVL
jgi:hypothetical protein